MIRTPFTDKYSAPRQPGDEGIVARGKVILERGHNFEQALEDVEGFEKIWLIYWFDRNANWKPKVLPPRGSKTKRGVFATRAPHRPNPIGLSLVTLVEVKGRNLIVEGVDMLDKTPLLDIKPYLPQFESFPDSAEGWVGLEKEPPKKIFIYSDTVKTFFATVTPTEERDLRAHIEHLLRYEIAPHRYKRITLSESGVYTLGYKFWRIIFHTSENETIHIEAIHNVGKEAKK